MVELCSQCGKSSTGAGERCPHCNAEMAVTLPGAPSPEIDDGKVALPAPEKNEGSAVDTSLSEIFDDFDPMGEFASSGAGEAENPDLKTLGGFELTPPTAAGDDVLDFIDTGLEAPPSPELPSLITEIELMGLDEEKEPPQVVPAEKEAPQVGFTPDEAVALFDPPPIPEAPPPPPLASPVPQVPSAAPSPAVPVAEPPVVAKKGSPRKRLQLLVLAGALGGLAGVAAFFFMGTETPELVFEDEPLPKRAAVAKKSPPEPPKAEAATVVDECAKAEAVRDVDECAKGVTEAAPAEAAAADGAAAEAAAAEGGEVAGADAAPADAEPEPEEPPSFFAEAEALEREEKWEEALAAFLQAAGPEKGPLDEAHLRRSKIYQRQGELPRALLEARRAVGENAERLDARLHLAGLFETMGSLKDARETYEAALGSHPDDPVLLERLGRLYLSIGAPWQAVDLLESRVGGSSPPSLRLALGEAYLGASSWSRAVATLAPIATEPHAAYPLARALLEQGKLRQALPHLERAAKEGNAEPVVHRHLGFVYKELGRRADAARAFRAYLANDPEALDRREIEDEVASLTR